MASSTVSKKAAPSPPYTIVMGYRPLYITGDSVFLGFCWRRSGDGRFIHVGADSNSGSDHIRVVKWNSPTSSAGGYSGPAKIMPFTGTPMWIRLVDNNINRIVSVSVDGINWLQIHSIGRTDFLTADEVGFLVIMQNASFAAALSLAHWVQS
jgi:hypothetical protein